MSGIPVYTQSPISAAKASGRTSQTATPQSSTSISATATTTASSTSSYPPAQPGSAAFPAPTSAAQQRYAPLQPTRTTKPDEGPATPQPGAVPTPISRSTIPPPPKAGESYHPPQQTEGSVQPRAYPPQMSIPPPTSAYRAQPLTSSTTTSTSASILYPVGIPSADDPPRRSLEHPPGYHQNIHASELTNQQKRAQEANRSGFSTGDGASDLDTEGVWNTAKKWAAQAGERISEAEAEVWRRVTKE
jgi:hypothetical protein